MVCLFVLITAVLASENSRLLRTNQALRNVLNQLEGASVASVNKQVALSSDKETAVSETDAMTACHCEAFAKMALEFCTEENLNSQSLGETCFEVQNYINSGLNLFGEAEQCHLDVCGQADDQFLRDFCEDMHGDLVEHACSSIFSITTRRRRLTKPVCFDELVTVILKDGTETAIRDVDAGSWVETCEPGIFTAVLAKIDHQQNGVPMKELHLEDRTSLVLTDSHMVYSEGRLLIPAHAVAVGTIIDGRKVVKITDVAGHPTNVVTFRQDIRVNGICASWLTEEFMPVAKFQSLWDVMNHVRFPLVVYASTQAVADFFVPLLDNGTIGINTVLLVMLSTGFLLVFVSAAITLGIYTLAHNILLGHDLTKIVA